MTLFRKPLDYLFKRKKYYTPYYRRTIIRYEYPESYLKIYRSLKSFNAILNTNIKINFFDDVPFGATIKKVKSNINGSFRVVKKIKNITVLFTEIKISSAYKFMVEVHFFKNKLVFFRYVFKNKTEIKKIEKLIKDKYVGTNENIDFNNSCILNEDNNYIFIEDEVKLSLNYITFNYGFYDYLLKLENEKDLELISKYNKSIKRLYAKL